jgi:two-component system chemotaxis sensor kinase CheA
MTGPFDIAPDELEAFLQDTDDQIALLNESIVRLEDEADDRELLQAVFRAAHTLKGSAGLIRHERMARLTHALETVLDCVRKGTMSVTPQLIDVMLTCIDLITALKEEVAGGAQSGVDVEATIEWLCRLQSDDEQANGAARCAAMDLGIDGATSARIKADTTLTLLHIRAKVQESSIAPAVRLYQALIELEAYGEIVRSAPSMSEIEGGFEARGIEILLLSQADAETVRGVLLDISEMDTVEIETVTLDEADHHTGPAGASSTMPVPCAATPAAEARPEGNGNGAGPETRLDNRVRISIDQLDRLMNLTGELVVSRTHLMQIESDLKQNGNAAGHSNAQLGEITVQMSRIIDQLAEEVMRARMVPMAPLFAKFPRLVRDVARALGKQVELVIEGQDTELDRSVIESIGDPLIHLLRNSVDHGIEMPAEREKAGKSPKGRVLLSAEQREGHIHIVVSDDGQGINPARLRQAAVAKGLINEESASALSDDEAIELIFMSGASTAKEVTDISGRGVGMDIVRANIERINGSIEVHSELGRGTTFELTLPLTMAIVPSMLVSVANGIYAVPLASVVDVQRLQPEDIRTVEGKETTVLRDQVLPLLRLRRVFGIDSATARKNNEQLVVIRAGRMQAGLIVDRLIGNQEVVIKALGPMVSSVRGLAGGSVLGNGRIALVLDIPEVFRIAMRQRDQHIQKVAS